MNAGKSFLVLILLASTSFGADPAFRLMSKERDEAYRKLIPALADKDLAKLLVDGRTIVYTDYEMPEAHQDFEGALQGVHNKSYNISADHSEPYGNGNIEFPWGTPAGLHQSSNYGTFRFLALPKRDDGTLWPLAWWRQQPGAAGGRSVGQQTSGYDWAYPVGTVVVEILYLTSPQGAAYPFEVRTRTHGTYRWAMNAYRPYRTAKELAEAVKTFRPNWRQHEPTNQLMTVLQTPLTTNVSYLADNQPDMAVIRQYKQIEKLPAIDHDLVRDLMLNPVFRSALGTQWKDGKNSPTMPTTDADFHIVPAGYTAGFINVDSKSCMRCHSSTNKHVDNFNGNREWYGRVRGADSIFSFHPFDLEAISYSGYQVRTYMNRGMTEAGVIAEYDQAVHPAKLYNKLPEKEVPVSQ